MSGYCPDCGNTMCICGEVERQNHTPRTDEALTLTGNAFLDFARQLERELADMTAERDSEQRWANQYKQERDEAKARRNRWAKLCWRLWSERDALRSSMTVGKLDLLDRLITAIKDRDEARRMYMICHRERGEARECLMEAREMYVAQAEEHLGGLTPGEVLMVERWRKAEGLDGE